MALLAALWPGLFAHAGLLTEGTRLIFLQGHHSQTLTISNINPWPVLVQSWVDRGEGELDSAEAPFVVVPFITRLEHTAGQSLRIFQTAEGLPEDRESLYWLNLYEIPPTIANGDADTVDLTLTINTQLKLLYRPKALGPPDNLAARLEFWFEQQAGHWCLHGYNPTPWYASLGALWVETATGPLGVEDPDLLLPPFSERCYYLPDVLPDAQARIHFSLIDDAGASTEH